MPTSKNVVMHARPVVATAVNVKRKRAAPEAYCTAPPPVRKMTKKVLLGPANWKRNWGPRTGVFLRIGESREFDHDALDRKQPVCSSSRCSLWCCNAGYGWKTYSAQQQRQLVRKLRAQQRGAYERGRKDGVDAYLRNLIHRPLQRPGDMPRHPFKSKTKITVAQGFAQRGCSWCNTVLGDIDRKHFYRPSGKNSFCPRYAEGQAWLARTKKPRVDFLLPPEEGTYTRLQVSRSFWMSLFLIGASSLKRLCEASITTDFLSTLSQTGRTRGAHKVGTTKSH